MALNVEEGKELQALLNGEDMFAGKKKLNGLGYVGEVTQKRIAAFAEQLAADGQQHPELADGGLSPEEALKILRDRQQAPAAVEAPAAATPAAPAATQEQRLAAIGELQSAIDAKFERENYTPPSGNQQAKYNLAYLGGAPELTDLTKSVLLNNDFMPDMKDSANQQFLVEIQRKLARGEDVPHAMEIFHGEVDNLAWPGRRIPTFGPDGKINPETASLAIEGALNGSAEQLQERFNGVKEQYEQIVQRQQEEASRPTPEQQQAQQKQETEAAQAREAAAREQTRLDGVTGNIEDLAKGMARENTASGDYVRNANGRYDLMDFGSNISIGLAKLGIGSGNGIDNDFQAAVAALKQNGGVISIVDEGNQRHDIDLRAGNQNLQAEMKQFAELAASHNIKSFDSPTNDGPPATPDARTRPAEQQRG